MPPSSGVYLEPKICSIVTRSVALTLATFRCVAVHFRGFCRRIDASLSVFDVGLSIMDIDTDIAGYCIAQLYKISKSNKTCNYYIQSRQTYGENYSPVRGLTLPAVWK